MKRKKKAKEKLDLRQGKNDQGLCPLSLDLRFLNSAGLFDIYSGSVKYRLYEIVETKHDS